MKDSSNSVTRRAVLKDVGLAAGAGLAAPVLGVASPSRSPAQVSSRPRALALCADRSHNADEIRMSLARLFKEVDIPIDYTIECDQISASLLSKYQLFVAFRNGEIWPDGYATPDLYTDPTASKPRATAALTEEQGLAIQNFVKAGNGLYAYHNSNIIGLVNKNFREVMGGIHCGHPPIRPFVVRATENKHPITEGIGEFWVEDEQHYVQYFKDPKYLILESENMDGIPWINKPGDVRASLEEVPPGNYGTKAKAGWAYDYGNGRVVYTAMGHTFHAMWTPQYFEIQKRAVRWLLKQKDLSSNQG